MAKCPGGSRQRGGGSERQRAFSTAILIASRSISRGLAFAIFVGSTSLHGDLAAACTTGLHAAFYTSMGFMVLAAVLPANRVSSVRARGSG